MDFYRASNSPDEERCGSALYVEDAAVDPILKS
jgi:hypothetical protein